MHTRIFVMGDIISDTGPGRGATSPYDPGVVPEAKLDETEAGLVPASPGWFVLNARDARWFENAGGATACR